MKVALVHYWLLSMRGGERVLEALCEMYPDAEIFTHVYDPSHVSSTIRRHRVHTSFVSRLPRARTWYQRYLPLMPLALEGFDLRGFDLIISSESGPAKGVVVPPDAVHVCYCHTPMRYIWDMYEEYRRSAGRIVRFFMPPVAHYLRMWDVTTAARVDTFVANSQHVASRIRRNYGREAVVIAPPVDTAAFQVIDRRPEDFFLMIGQLVPYKRVDLAVEAFRRIGMPLVIIGDGPESRRLRRSAPPNVRFLGRQPLDVLRDHLARCRALVFPGEEDFGIVPLEAMAAGVPVVAYGRGGAVETVVDGVPGVLFTPQSPEGLAAGVARFERLEQGFDRRRLAAHAAQFDRRVFKERMRRLIDDVVAARGGGGAVAKPDVNPGENA